MAVKRNIIERSVLERDANGIVSAIERCSVDTEDMMASTNATTLNDASLHPSLPAFGTAYETGSLCKHNRRVVTGYVAKKGFVDLYFQRPKGGDLLYVPNTWKVVDVDGNMTGVQASALPRGAANAPPRTVDTFFCGYVPETEWLESADSNNYQKSSAITKIHTTPMLRSIRVITLIGNFTTNDHALISSAFGCQGKVNSNTLCGKPIGFWLCDQVKISDLGSGLGWQGVARIFTLINEDWSSWLFAKNQQGDSVMPRVDDNSGEKTFRGAGDAYEFSIRPAEMADREVNGFLRIGPYKTANFSNGFGNPTYPAIDWDANP